MHKKVHTGCPNKYNIRTTLDREFFFYKNHEIEGRSALL